MVREKAVLAVIRQPKKDTVSRPELETELSELTLSAGGVIADIVRGSVDTPVSSTFVGKGKLAEIREKVLEKGAHVIIFNLDLTPAQAHNIESECGARVVDRTGLILDIFARRAQSREGRLQVELAQLNYLLPRLVGMGVVMSRLGGGIGTRGPGEQKLEVDRRKIRLRILKVKEELAKQHRHRALLRSGRRRKNLMQAAIVGYTNAGKSTLLEALTGSRTYIADQLFATLDSKTRILSLTGRKDVLFTDTVGFIRDLPHGLVEAFHATLEEVTEADFIIHVLDISHPKALSQKKIVEEVLEDLKAREKPTLLVFNKADLVSDETLQAFHQQFSQAITISAKQKLGLRNFLAALDELMPEKGSESSEFLSER